jgi:glyoxylase-like metal-dependent hydrolase (beta-lactamase superfamily II)
MKRVLKWLGIVFGVLGILAGSFWLYAFGNNSRMVDGAIVAPGVQLVKDGIVSLYLVDVGQGKVALVDAGNDRSGKAVLAALAKRGLSPASVAAIFLTHGHPDHTRGCNVFPGTSVYAMQADVDLVADAAKITRPLKDGDVIDVEGTRVEAFATPGHTPGSAAYLVSGVLFFGDSAGASKAGEVMQAVRLFSKDPQLNVTSLKALAARLQPRAAEVKALAFGHTGPLAGLQPLAVFADQH